MELYHDFPKLTTSWCFVEVFMYSGHLFGWSSLLYILKTEGFYVDLCFKGDSEISFVSGDKHAVFSKADLNGSIATYGIISNTTENGVIFPINNENTENFIEYSEDGPIVSDVIRECPTQNAKLNLWFSVAIFTSYFTCAFLGPLLRKTGVFLFRLIFICLFSCGALCLAFASTKVPWLICPGLCFVGVSGMALYTTNIQTSFLFPTVQSTITSVFVGLFDASTIFTQLSKIAFESGYSRQTYYIAYTIIHVLLLGSNTVFFMPRVRIEPKSTRKIKKKGTIEKEKETFISLRPSSEKSLSTTLVSAQYLLHVYWMGVQGVRFVTFLGFLNSWLSSRFDGNKIKESYYLSVFSYTTLGTALSAITAGMLHDCQRRQFIGYTDFKRKRLPIVLPLVLTTLMSIVTTALTFVAKDTTLYIVFILFTIYRSYLFSFEVTFINDVFPMEYFTVLFGILHSSSGLAGMLQFPLFKWYQAYENAPVHVNLFFIILEVTTLIHPFYIWLKCRRHTDNPTEFSLNYDLQVVPDTNTDVKPL